MNWNQEILESYIRNQVEENINLDYKSGTALDFTKETFKKEFCKDISSFANSNGGIIIYGIKEYDETDKSHLPEKFSPIDGQKISKERLEQIINTQIKPRINNIKIHSVRLDGDIKNTIYIIDIPRSDIGHQNNDKRYYRRFNFMSVPMEDFEIKDLLNRENKAEILFSTTKNDIEFDVGQYIISIPINISNISKVLAKDILCTLEIYPKEIEVLDFENYFNNSNNNAKNYLFQSNNNNIKAYFGTILNTGTLRIKTSGNMKSICFHLNVMGDNIEYKRFHFHIKLDNNNFELETK